MKISVETGNDLGRSLAPILNFDSHAMLVEVVCSSQFSPSLVSPCPSPKYRLLGSCWTTGSNTTLERSDLYARPSLCLLIFEAQINGVVVWDLSEELSWDRTLPRKSRKRRLVDESTIHNRGPVVIASPSLELNLNIAPITAETHHLRKRNLAARYLIRLVDHLNNPRSHIKGDLIRQVLVHRNQNITPTPTI